MPIDIVVDGMGSDKAPEPEVRGAILACRHFDVRVHLVGPEEILRPALDRALRAPRWPGSASRTIHIVHASEWISMDDKAAQAVRAKRDSSMRVGLRMVREGSRRGFFTAGNTGAAMATAKMVLGMLAGVHRPALATILPTVTGSPSLLLDVGANVDCDPDNLVQFAVMGHMYARNVLRMSRTRASACSPSAKRTPRATPSPTTPSRCCAILPASTSSATSKAATSSTADCDVAVCDGFVGNVAIKIGRGHRANWSARCCARRSSPPSPRRSARCSPAGAFNDFKKRLDYSEYGGAPLLGVRGVCIVGHGSSNEKAVMNGIRVAAEFAQAEVNSAHRSRPPHDLIPSGPKTARFLKLTIQSVGVWYQRIQPATCR